MNFSSPAFLPSLLFLLRSSLACALIECCLGCQRPSAPSAFVKMSERDKYPAHWWTPASKDGAPSWEILPQEAGPGEVILSKRHELGLLSNFAATPFTLHGKSTPASRASGK